MPPKKKQDRSMHYIGPEPIVMVRSDSKQQTTGKSKSSMSALQMIDDLLDEGPKHAEEFEQQQYGWNGVEEQRGRQASRDSFKSDGRRSTSRSVERMAQPGSRSRQGSANIFHDSENESRADDFASRLIDNYQRSAYLDPSEQPYHGRPRRSTREIHEDMELQKRSERIWGRSPWHPLSIIQGIWDSLTASKLRIIIFLGILLLIGLSIGLVTLIVLPRPVTIKFIDIEHDQNPEPYRVVPREQGIHLRVQSWVLVEVRNPNYFPAKIMKSQVIANWIMSDGRREMFGGSITDEETQLKKKEKYMLRLPITIEYMGNPESDPIYSDFISRCFFDDKGPNDRNIYLNFEIIVTTLAKDIHRERIIHVERSMACPMGKDTIKKTLEMVYPSLAQRSGQKN